MTSLGIAGEVEYDRRKGDDGWPKPLVGVLGLVLFTVFGWLATDYATTKHQMQEAIASNQQRIAVLEEQRRNDRDQFNRIENGVQELRQQMERRSGR